MIKKQSEVKKAITDTALTLAEKHGWEKFTMNELQQECGVSQTVFRASVKNKRDVFRIICDSFKETATAEESQDSYNSMEIKDIFFDIILLRFEVMNRNRQQVLSMEKTVIRNPEYLAILWNAISDISENINKNNGKKRQKDSFFIPYRLALCIMIAYVYRTWRNDSSPGMDKTMTALDKAIDIFLNKLRHKTA